MMNLVFVFKVAALLVGLVKIAKSNAKKESGAQNVKMTVAIVLMEHRVIGSVSYLGQVIMHHKLI